MPCSCAFLQLEEPFGILPLESLCDAAQRNVKELLDNQHRIKSLVEEYAGGWGMGLPPPGWEAPLLSSMMGSSSGSDSDGDDARSQDVLNPMGLPGMTEYRQKYQAKQEARGQEVIASWQAETNTAGTGAAAGTAAGTGTGANGQGIPDAAALAAASAAAALPVSAVGAAAAADSDSESVVPASAPGAGAAGSAQSGQVQGQGEGMGESEGIKISSLQLNGFSNIVANLPPMVHDEARARSVDLAD